ncbi:S-layer homology domain-containing protein [Paenibacillus sp. 7541]|uniref:S-layer homology domain-containing protein n=1 Tax=Paenibacillus sp. 7541 TaxID=2026236 RepID=UPI000BA570D0|nr:S-layer homology domain-containing protein [Paenibacillus sp. 7541]PAK50442.1 S-layer protein [Paenibacillus sp. 7541]
MNKTTKLITSILVTSSLLGAGAASAFTDIQGEQPLQMVKELQAKGIIQGVSADKFAPSKTITTAQAVQMIVNAAQLESIAGAGDARVNVPENAWYADAVQIAAEHGLSVSENMKWNEAITREAFAQLLYEAVEVTGPYPVIKMYINVADADLMKQDSLGAVQFLLLTKIAELDEQGNFRPTDTLTRLEAAELAYRAVQFLEMHQENAIPDKPEQDDPAVTTEVVKVDANENKVIVTKEDLPNPGYAIKITSVDYVGEDEAVVYYTVVEPDPDKMYPQVITAGSDEVLVPAKYTNITTKLADKLELLP